MVLVRPLHAIALFVIILNTAKSYKILGIFPHPGISHFAVFKPVLEALSERGHQITVVSHFPSATARTGYTDINLQGTCKNVSEIVLLNNVKGSRLEKYLGIAFVRPFATWCCEGGLASPQIQKLVRSEEKFDIILVEFFNTHCFAGLIKKFNAPFVGLSSHVLMPWVNDWMGNPDNPSYIPIIHMDYSDQLTFLERLENSIVSIFSKAYYNVLMTGEAIEISRRHLGQALRVPDNIMYNASLVLVNSHYSLNRPRPLVPNVVEVGGVHIVKRGQLPAVCCKIETDTVL